MRREALIENLMLSGVDLAQFSSTSVFGIAALRGDPSLADCHYNLGLLYESLGRKRDAIRHLSQYRRLTRRSK